VQKNTTGGAVSILSIKKQVLEWSNGPMLRWGHTAVDLACGTGFTTEAILRKLGETGCVYAVDYSAPMLEKAMEYIQ